MLRLRDMRADGRGDYLPPRYNTPHFSTCHLPVFVLSPGIVDFPQMLHTARSMELCTGYHFFDNRQYVTGFSTKVWTCLTD